MFGGPAAKVEHPSGRRVLLHRAARNRDIGRRFVWATATLAASLTGTASWLAAGRACDWRLCRDRDRQGNGRNRADLKVGGAAGGELKSAGTDNRLIDQFERAVRTGRPSGGASAVPSVPAPASPPQRLLRSCPTGRRPPAFPAAAFPCAMGWVPAAWTCTVPLEARDELAALLAASALIRYSWLNSSCRTRLLLGSRGVHHLLQQLPIRRGRHRGSKARRARIHAIPSRTKDGAGCSAHVQPHSKRLAVHQWNR